MPFEFHNPQVFRVGCCLGGGFGEYKVNPGEYVPTPEQEEAGITAARFQEHVGKSFLRRTPPDVRRSLLQAAGIHQKPVRTAQPVAVAQPALQPAVAAVESLPNGSGIPDNPAAPSVDSASDAALSEAAPSAEIPAPPAPAPIPPRRDPAAPELSDIDRAYDKAVNKDYPNK